jgi:tetratricopeptide (TPR) repeat protein
MTSKTPPSNTWPGGQARNAPCGCGSGKKYKHCCGSAAGHQQGPAELPAGPQTAEEQFRRGAHLLRNGQTLAAMPILLGAMVSDPGHFEAHHALGSALLQVGRLADASTILSQAVTLRPGSAAAWGDLATAYDRQNLHPQAIAAYHRAVELAPKSDGMLRRLGELCVLYSRTEEASDCFERAAAVKPETTNARLYRSDASLLRGDLPNAERWAREAVASEPASAAAQGTLGGLLYAQGHFEEAAEHFETALRLDPKAARCWDGLVHCRTFSQSDKAVLERMRAVLERGGLTDAERMTIHFAMGKVCDDCGDYAHAMQQFDAGNRLRARDLKFDRAGLARLVDGNIERFTQDVVTKNVASGTLDSKPLFVVGMYRSGTTLVEQIVSSHPDIAAGGELTVWAPTDLEVEAATGAFDAARAQAAIEKYLSVLQKIGPSAARVTDKLPFNCFRLGAIHSLMPNARIIHCRRDPIDTCLSIYSTLFKSQVSFAASKGDLAFCYRQYQRLMDHWRSVLPPDRFLEVDYERLIAERETETRRLIAFIGLGWNDACLRPEENTRLIGTASAWQARQPVYATSLRRWRHYEPWIGELRQLLPAGDG